MVLFEEPLHLTSLTGCLECLPEAPWEILATSWSSFLRSLLFVVSKCDIRGDPDDPGFLEDLSLPPLGYFSAAALDFALLFSLLLSLLPLSLLNVSFPFRPGTALRLAQFRLRILHGCLEREGPGGFQGRCNAKLAAGASISKPPRVSSHLLQTWR